MRGAFLAMAEWDAQRPLLDAQYNAEANRPPLEHGNPPKVGLAPGRQACFSYFQQSSRDHTEYHEEHDRHKDARRLKRMGIRDDEVSRPAMAV